MKCFFKLVVFLETVETSKKSAKNLKFVRLKIKNKAFNSIPACQRYKRVHNVKKFHPLQDHKVHIFTLDGDTLKETQTINNHKGALTDIKYNPEGSIMAAADANRRILLYTVPGYKVRETENGDER